LDRLFAGLIALTVAVIWTLGAWIIGGDVVTADPECSGGHGATKVIYALGVSIGIYCLCPSDPRAPQRAGGDCRLHCVAVAVIVIGLVLGRHLIGSGAFSWNCGA
jgi:hypothetical protein